MIPTIEDIRNAVASSLQQTGHGNSAFLQSIRDGEQDDGPFMRGALAVLELIATADV